MGVDDAQLVKRIARERIPLTLCPLSNLKLRVVDDMKEFPLRELLDANVCCTINSDDPAYFGGYVNDNFKAVTKSLNLTLEDLTRCAKDSFEASFATKTQKEKWTASVDEYCQKFLDFDDEEGKDRKQ